MENLNVFNPLTVTQFSLINIMISGVYMDTAKASFDSAHI